MRLLLRVNHDAAVTLSSGQCSVAVVVLFLVLVVVVVVAARTRQTIAPLSLGYDPEEHLNKTNDLCPEVCSTVCMRVCVCVKWSAASHCHNKSL